MVTLFMEKVLEHVYNCVVEKDDPFQLLVLNQM